MLLKDMVFQLKTGFSCICLLIFSLGVLCWFMYKTRDERYGKAFLLNGSLRRMFYKRSGRGGLWSAQTVKRLRINTEVEYEHWKLFAGIDLFIKALGCFI